MTSRVRKHIWRILCILIICTLVIRMFYYDSSEWMNAVSTRGQELRQLINCRNRELKLQKLQYDSYWVLSNLIVGRKSRDLSCADSITYATHGDITVFENLEAIAMRWLAPISIAIFTPGFDLNSTLDSIMFVRKCLPGSKFIKDFVSFHLFFPTDHMPSYVPLTEEAVLQWPVNCEVRFGTILSIPVVRKPKFKYRVKAKLIPPLSVALNIARKAVNTHFTLTSDLVLFPPLHFVNNFLDLLHQNHSVLTLHTYEPPRVYVLPAFQVPMNSEIPSSKYELMKMLRTDYARRLNDVSCVNCHNVPNLKDWLYKPKARFQDYLTVHTYALRQNEFKTWQPFFISDNKEPFFDERISSNPQANRRIQGYAMCILGYEYHILHPAFLVQRDRGQQATASENDEYTKELEEYVKNLIEPDYRKLYGINKKCFI